MTSRPNIMDGSVLAPSRVWTSDAVDSEEAGGVAAQLVRRRFPKGNLLREEWLRLAKRCTRKHECLQ